MNRYANLEDSKLLLETLATEEERELFLFGFYSAIGFAYYDSLTKEEKELWCEEMLERATEHYGLELFERFLEELGASFEKR